MLLSELNLIFTSEKTTTKRNQTRWMLLMLLFLFDLFLCKSGVIIPSSRFRRLKVEKRAAIKLNWIRHHPLREINNSPKIFLLQEDKFSFSTYLESSSLVVKFSSASAELFQSSITDFLVPSFSFLNCSTHSPATCFDWNLLIPTWMGAAEWNRISPVKVTMCEPLIQSELLGFSVSLCSRVDRHLWVNIHSIQRESLVHEVSRARIHW